MHGLAQNGKGLNTRLSIHILIFQMGKRVLFRGYKALRCIYTECQLSVISFLARY